MKQRAFRERYEKLWVTLEAWLDTHHHERDKALVGSIPRLYRQVCHHLALARARNYSPMLQERLNRLALRGHRQLYGTRPQLLRGLARFFARDFPRAVRTNWRPVAVAALLFYLPFTVLGVAVYKNPPLTYSVISPSDAAMMRSMYEPDTRRIGVRDSEDDFAMFGMYIWNNVSIGFRTFASGLVVGIGAILILAFNGTIIGTVVGHLTEAGLGGTLWPFIAGHGAFELNAIVLAGAAGLMLGYSVVAPGRRTRKDAIRAAATRCMPLVYGFTTMLVLAAFIEAFWSSSVLIPPVAKYAVGASLWLFVLLYFGFAGRTRESE